jgi:hypothetical protein
VVAKKHGGWLVSQGLVDHGLQIFTMGGQSDFCSGLDAQIDQLAQEALSFIAVTGVHMENMA